MSEEKDWNKKRILMAIVGAIVLGIAAGLHDTTKQIVKDFFNPPQEASTNDLDDHTQTGQTGDHIEVNIITDIELAKQLDIPKATAQDLLKILDQQKVSPEKVEATARNLLITLEQKKMSTDEVNYKVRKLADQPTEEAENTLRKLGVWVPY